jgi:hypothetical protein
MQVKRAGDGDMDKWIDGLVDSCPKENEDEND